MTRFAVALMLSIAVAAPAAADPPPWAPAHGKRAKDLSRALGSNDLVWKDKGGQFRCYRSDGTVGLILGASAGALIGNRLDGGRQRLLGTVIGAAAGAAIGYELDSDLRCG